MIKVSASETIATIVECLLPRSYSETKGLLLQLRVELADSNGDNPATRYATFVFQRPNNYTKVFVSINNSPVAPNKIKNWKLTAHHDSTWREDGVRAPLSEIFFEMAKQFKQAPARLTDDSRLDALNQGLYEISVTRNEKPKSSEDHFLLQVKTRCNH